MVKRVLVTTALEDTWPKDGSPILFLGEWCKLYERKHVWEKLDYEVAPYHWDDRRKLYEDYKNLLVIYEDMLSALAVKLNEVHGVNYSLRYWRILIGPWLGYFIQMLFDRWFMLDATFRKHDLAGVFVFHREPHDVVPSDMSDFIQRFVDDDWNEAIYGGLLIGFFAEKLKINKISAPIKNLSSNSSEFAPSTKSKNFFLLFKSVTKKVLLSISRVLPSNISYFFISSYLPPKINFLLQIWLRQIPRFFFSSELTEKTVEPKKRAWSIELKNIGSENSDFAKILADMIPRHVPVAYLEGYSNLVDTGEKLDWPNRPKLIFTSNAYSSDDVFKAWAAQKTENGSKLVIGQHGGHFGMTPFAFHEEHQIEIADQFISWGWTDNSRPQVKPLGNFKDVRKAKIKNDKNGKALLVQMTMPRYSYHLYAKPDSAVQWNNYFKDQVRFVASLRDEIRNKLLVRLYRQDYGCGQESHWRDAFQDIMLDDGARPITDLLKKSRLYISTYNATTYLESFTLNFPTLIFWNPDHWELKEEVMPFFDLLESVGVFHKTPESAAKKMNEIWDDVDKWWFSHETQAAKDAFCARYAKRIDQPVSELASLLKNSL